MQSIALSGTYTQSAARFLLHRQPPDLSAFKAHGGELMLLPGRLGLVHYNEAIV